MSGWAPIDDIPERSPSYVKKVWRQGDIPVVHFDKAQGLRVKLPYRKDNRFWLSLSGRKRPKWNPQYKCWEIPKAWFQDVVNRCLHRFGNVYVVQARRSQEKCAPACWNAAGHLCECSCAGVNHGMGRPGGRWFVVSDACAVSWGNKELSCKLLTKKEEE